MDALESVSESRAAMHAQEARRDQERQQEFRAERYRAEQRRADERAREPGRGDNVDRYA